MNTDFYGGINICKKVEGTQTIRFENFFLSWTGLYEY